MKHLFETIRHFWTSEKNIAKLMKFGAPTTLYARALQRIIRARPLSFANISRLWILGLTIPLGKNSTGGTPLPGAEHVHFLSLLLLDTFWDHSNKKCFLEKWRTVAKLCMPSMSLILAKDVLPHSTGLFFSNTKVTEYGCSSKKAVWGFYVEDPNTCRMYVSSQGAVIQKGNMPLVLNEK